MDLSSLLGGGQSQTGDASDKERTPTLEYDAVVSSHTINGEVKLSIGENSFTAAALFDMAEIPFAEVNAIRLVDYTVTIEADSGDYTFSRMGNWCQPFHDTLCDAYNTAVLRSLFVEGKPILTGNGEFRYAENGKAASGSAPIHVYENCVLVLPPDLKARRVPLCFASGMDNGGYSLTLTLDTGESYTFSKLGYDTAPFADTVEKQIRKLRGKSLAATKELDPTLTAAQASQLVRLMPEGTAAPMGKLAAIAPSFVAAIESKLSETRATDSYKTFKKLCDPAQICLGIKKNDDGAGMAGGMGEMLNGMTGGGNPLAALGSMIGNGAPADGEETEAPLPDPYLFWLIAPSPDGKYATVEFSEADCATFVYKTSGDFDAFARQLNRALEAISFKREVIRLTDAELLKPDNADYYMASKRTAALQFVRANFAGRVIHSNHETWKKKLLALWDGAPQSAQIPTVQGKSKFCGGCGAKNEQNVKFCGKCGSKL